MSGQSIVVFADGSAKGNPGPGGWGVVIVLPDGQVTELGGGSPHTTNNRMELAAVIEALTALRSRPGAVALYTDSTYVIRGITEWLRSWRRRGWKTAEGTPVLNREQWETLAGLVAARGGDGAITWHYVRGHTGVAGNERVDAIADGQATGRLLPLYHGALVGYDIAVLDLPDDTRLPARGASRGSNAKAKPAYSYLSLVDGQLMRHATWAECERRVKGRSGARFKKATSAADETAILRAWGVAEEER